MTDTPEQIAAIKARAERASPGPWVAWERQHSYRFNPSKPEYKGKGFHTETFIITAYNDPQAKAPYTIVGQASGIGVDDGPWVTFVKIEPNDADFIAHARTDIPALIAEVERLTAERDALKAGLHILATTFYKDDQHQAYALHVLEASKRPRYRTGQSKRQWKR